MLTYVFKLNYLLGKLYQFAIQKKTFECNYSKTKLIFIHRLNYGSIWKIIKYVLDISLVVCMWRNKYLASWKSFTYLSYILCIGLLYNDMRKPVTILRFIWKTIVKIKCLFLMLLYYAPCCARNTGIEFFLK